MRTYIRHKSDNPDEQYFLTLVTKDRKPVFSSINIKRTLWREWENCANKAGGELIAFVFLNDHIHILIRQGILSYSKWVHNFKRRINYKLLNGKGTIWQPRFWEHRIKDDNDFARHVDYIHYNPVKHGYCANPVDYEASSFKHYLKLGHYEEDWSSSEDYVKSDFGE